MSRVQGCGTDCGTIRYQSVGTNPNYATMSPITVLTNPDGFFERASDDPSLLWPGLVVLAVGLVSAVASLPVIQAVQSAFPEQAAMIGTFALVGGVVGGFLGTAVFWVLYTVLFHVIAVVGFGGEGSLSRLLSFVGWGFLPGIFSAAVGVVVNYVVFQTVTPPTNPEQVQPFVQSVRSQPEFLVAGIVGLVVLLWQGFIWTFAVSHSHDLDLRSAAITVGIPIGIQALWQLYNLL